ncbi:MAG: hypothetical protein LJE92_11260 [Gammaproteobacteria bacterium]|nr:hypothetical protein [Gammaproteobacteria bacterium]
MQLSVLALVAKSTIGLEAPIAAAVQPLLRSIQPRPVSWSQCGYRSLVMLLRGLPSRWLLVLLVMLLTMAAAGANPIVENASVRGSDNRYFDDAIATPVPQVQPLAHIRAVQQAHRACAFSSQPEHSLFVAFGPGAVAAVKQLVAHAPLLSYSTADARSDGPASIYSSAIDIGGYPVLIVKQHFEHAGGIYPAEESTRFYSFTSNSRIFRTLAIKLPEEAKLRACLDLFTP